MRATRAEMDFKSESNNYPLQFPSTAIKPDGKWSAKRGINVGIPASSQRRSSFDVSSAFSKTFTCYSTAYMNTGLLH